MRSIVMAALLVTLASAAQLRIVVYDQARVPKEVTRTAFEDLRQIFHESGIEIELGAGDGSAFEASLITYPAPPPRGHEREAACLARRDIALEILAVAPAFAHPKSTTLGVSQPLAREGLNVRVFDDRIQDAAMRENRTHAAVLAHVIAHEIGHVLLRTNGHNPRGLMSSPWTDFEYGNILRGLMFFTADQSKTMRMALSGAGCANDAVVTRFASIVKSDFGPRYAQAIH
jgi:hypothetical protein